MVTAARFRSLALAFEGALEVPHMDRAGFRTKRRMFATLPADGATANLLLDLDVQTAVCEALPKSFAPVHGGWGRMGYTTVNLRTVPEPDLIRTLEIAYALAAEPRGRARAKPKAGKKRPRR